MDHQGLLKAKSALGQSSQEELSVEYLGEQARQANTMVLMKLEGALTIGAYSNSIHSEYSRKRRAPIL